MIRISEHTIFLRRPDGTAVPFDQDSLIQRIRATLPETRDDPDSLAHSAVNAVEFALLHNHPQKTNDESPVYVESWSVDEMVVKVLQSVGLHDSAAAYLRNGEKDFSAELSGEEYISSLLASGLPGIEPFLSQITCKVANTLRSIGATPHGQEILITELGRHFLNISGTLNSIPIELPEISEESSCRIQPEDIVRSLPDELKKSLDNHSLALKKIDLRIFPAIQIEVRFFPVLEQSNLDTPVTELSLASGLRPMAMCMNELCLAADAVCRAQGNDAVTPLKLVLEFPDVSEFAANAMKCSGKKETIRTIESLITTLTDMLSRLPEKITCS